MNTKKQMVAIVAKKKLTYNTRVARQIKALLAHGHKVVLFCQKKTQYSEFDNNPHVTCVEVGSIIYRMQDRVRPLLIGLFRFLQGIKSILRRKNGEELPAGKTCNHLSPMASPFAYFLESRLFALLLLWHQRYGLFDHVLSHDSLAIHGGGVLARRHGARFIADFVELPYLLSEPCLQPAWKKMVRYLFRRESETIRSTFATFTVSDGLSRLIGESYGISAPRVLRNCTLRNRNPAPSTLRHDLGLSANYRLVLFLNSVAPGLGVEQLVESLNHLPDSIHIAALGQVSSPEFHQKLKARLQENGNESRFHLVPLVHPSQVSHYASGADIGVLPIQDAGVNIYNCLPNRVFEMIGGGLPIAATSLPHIRDLVLQYGLGMVFDQKDPRDIARIICEMLKDDALRKFQENVAIAAQTLCWEKESKIFLKAIEKETPEQLGAERA